MGLPNLRLLSRETVSPIVVTATIIFTGVATCGATEVGDCTELALRAAIAPGGVVRFVCDGTITLSGPIVVTQDLALDAGDRSVTISGGNAVRLFVVQPGVAFTATNVTLANGRHQGADGTNGPIADPGQPGEGGAILNDGGHVILVSCQVAGNSAIGGSGGGSSGTGVGASGEARGGAISSRGGTVSLFQVTASSNTATGGIDRFSNFQAFFKGQAGNSLGGAIYCSNSVVEIRDSICSNNLVYARRTGGEAAAARGGAIYQESGALDVQKCLIAGNQALGEWSFNGNPLDSSLRPGSAFGGAVAAAGQVTMDSCRLLSNSVVGGPGIRHSGISEAKGGAVYSEAVLRAANTIFAGNSVFAPGGSSAKPVGHGGALYNVGSSQLDRCAVIGNHVEGGPGGNVAGFPTAGGDGQGGGVFNAGDMTVTNVTVALNSARGGGAFLMGLPGNGLGGGIFNANGAVIINATLASNSVAAGDPGPAPPSTTPVLPAGANLANSNGVVSLLNAILAYGGTNSNVFGPATDAGFNMCSDSSAGFTNGSSFNLTDPRLGPLADYGGPTPTMALRPNSPAIDIGIGAGGRATDQRGFSRPFGNGLDIGAYEFHSNQTELPVLAISRAIGGVQIRFEAWANTAYRLEAKSTGPDWVDVETIEPFPANTDVSRILPMSDAIYQWFRAAILSQP